MSSYNPFGSDEMPPIDKVMGEQLDPILMPEDFIEEGRHFVFGGDVPAVFEERVISRQIPGYDEMRYRMLHVARHCLAPDSMLLDLGTSTGRMIRDVIGSLMRSDEDPNVPDERLFTTSYLGVDLEQDMLAVAQDTMNDLYSELRVFLAATESPSYPTVELAQHDLRHGVPDEALLKDVPISVITSVFTIQFVPLMYRQHLIASIYSALAPGGAFIFAEKILGSSSRIDDMLGSIYYDDKRRNGMSQNAVDRKRESLTTIMHPLTHQWNVDLLTGAGFKLQNIDTVWRNLQFEAIVAFKE